MLSQEQPVRAKAFDASAVQRDIGLDKLRGLAILLVMIFHFFQVPNLPKSSALDECVIHFARMGWCGVELFFSLSGFLITRIILRTLHSKHFFRNFYIRRTLRIFPLYYAYLLLLSAVVVCAFMLGRLQEPSFNSFAAASPFLLGYLSNFYTFYTEQFTPLGTGHFWSLATEEQFYLLWPALLFLVPRSSLLPFAVSLLAFSLVLRIALEWLGASAVQIYVFFPARLDSIVFGGVAAIMSERFDPKLVRRYALPVCWMSGLLSVYLLFKYGPTAEHPAVHVYGLTVFGLFFSSLVCLVAISARKSQSSNISILAVFGTYSYGLYVIHVCVRAALVQLWPVSQLHLNSVLPSLVAFATLGISTSLGLAMLSFHFFEEPFLQLKRRFS
ncbi:hypothetical protein ACM43_04885 [Bradyrhizobium sp. CCBAU 45321]|uniref:acyltransferase family protein n=1 Tax=Bradyrhizobium sp. CCBAU 45321 TaxID=1641878 RepID=UPI00230424E4|nr:acyltransferase [Bradyrhizobium sp. CCBAU 45321]MDA9543898.1 hypothetical protein [Bradyrhizobium sp. CCBAU 45321]